MSTTVFDDRNPIIQYIGTWKPGGDPDEYRGTTTWTATVGDSARVVFTGRGISVYGAISPALPGRGKGPLATFMVDDDPSSSKRFAGQQTNVPQRQFLMYSANNLEYGQHVLTMVNEWNEGFFFVDFIEITGADNPGSSSARPSSSAAAPVPVPPAVNPSANVPAPSSSLPSSARPDPESPSSASRSSNGPTSVPNPSSSGSPPRESQSQVLDEPYGPSHSLILPPGVSAPATNQNSLPTPGSSLGDSKSSGVRLEAIIGGTIGGIAATCTLFLIFAICMRRRQRKRYGNIGSPEPEMQSIPPEPRSLPVHEKSSLAGHPMALVGRDTGRTSPPQDSLPLSSSLRRSSTIGQEPYTDSSRDSYISDALPPQQIPSKTAAIPLTRPSRRSSIEPPPQYQPPV